MVKQPSDAFQQMIDQSSSRPKSVAQRVRVIVARRMQPTMKTVDMNKSERAIWRVELHQAALGSEDAFQYHIRRFWERIRDLGGGDEESENDGGPPFINSGPYSSSCSCSCSSPSSMSSSSSDRTCSSLENSDEEGGKGNHDFEETVVVQLLTLD